MDSIVFFILTIGFGFITVILQKGEYEKKYSDPDYSLSDYVNGYSFVSFTLFIGSGFLFIVSLFYQL